MTWNWNAVSLGLTLLVMPISNAQQLHGGLMRTPYSVGKQLVRSKVVPGAGPNSHAVEQFVIGPHGHELVVVGVDARLGVEPGPM